MATGWNGLRDCDTGSGLNSARDVSENGELIGNEGELLYGFALFLLRFTQNRD